jgi:hypothetical protein
MSTKNEAAKPPVLVLRRPSAAQRARVEEPAATPAPENVAAQTNVEAPPIVAAQTIAAPPAPAPKPTRSREAERIEAEPDADFFVSIPKSKKNALKAYCAQRGISMRDWLLGVLNEKGIGK